MRSNKKPIPTEPYPRLIWYQEKRLPPTQEETDIIFKRYYDISLMRLNDLFPESSNINIKTLAEEKAQMHTDSEINLPTIMKKTQVKTAEEHTLTKKMIEESDVFLQWYQE